MSTIIGLDIHKKNIIYIIEKNNIYSPEFLYECGLLIDNHYSDNSNNINEIYFKVKIKYLQNKLKKYNIFT